MILLRIFLLAGFATSSICHAAEQPLTINLGQSRLRAEVKSTVHDFVAEVTVFHADILVDPLNAKVTRAVLDFDFSAVKTGDDKRDRDMLTWENDGTFPSVVFTLSSLENTADGEKFVAHGQLLFHGVSKPVVFPVFITSVDKVIYQIDGAFDLDTREYGLPIIRRFGLLKVEPVVRISLQVEGRVMPK